MNDQQNSIPTVDENVILGALGAFLFALAGGVLYVLLSMVGLIAWISGFVAVFCAIKGYTLFSKAKSKKGVIISVIMAAIVMILSWYIGFCMDMLAVYELYYEAGDIEYVPTFFEYLPYSYLDLQVNPLAFLNLLLSLVTGAAGCWSYVSQTLKDRAKDESPDFEPNTTADMADNETFSYSVDDPTPAEAQAPAEESDKNDSAEL